MTDQTMSGERKDRLRHLIGRLFTAHINGDDAALRRHIKSAEAPDLYRAAREVRLIADEMMAEFEIRKRKQEL